MKKIALIALVGILSSIVSTDSIWSAYQVDGSFTANTLQTNQQGRVARNASMTLEIGGFINSFPALNNTSTQCFNQQGPSPAYPYGIFLDNSSINMSQCEAFNGTEIIRNAGVFIIDPFTAFTTKATPTEIANAMVAKGTLGTAFTITSGGGRDVIFTRTNSSDGNIVYTNSIFDSSDAFRVKNVVSGQSPLTSLVQQSIFTPANIGSGEVYTMDIEGYDYTYTAESGDTVSDVTAGIVAEYNLTGNPNVTCVDQTTRVLCSGTLDTQSFSIDSYVAYPTPDTTAPQLTLIGSGTVQMEVGGGFYDEGADWIDNRAGTGFLYYNTGTLNANVLGTYTIGYQYTDPSGNVGEEVQRIVEVVDTTAPVITILGSGSITQELDLPYTDAGATWTDDVDGSGTLTASGISLMTGRGTYTLTYEKTDAAGNIGTGSRDVTIVDTIAPVVTLTTLPITVDASVYQISGRAPGSNFIDIYSGSTLLASATPVDGYFSIFVPLVPSSANMFFIEATDTGRNTGTGQVVITTSSGTSGFTGAVQVSGSTLSGATVFSGASFTGVTQVTLTAPVYFSSSSGGTSVIPTGTVITGASGTVFDASAINALSVTVTGGLASNQTSNGALEFGLSGTGLYFSRPIKIQIPISGYSGTTIAVKVKHGGTTTYVTTGLTNNPNATCTNGISNSPSAIATISGGFATIYTCAASTFVTYTETAIASSNSSGGGSFFSSSAPIVLTGSTPIMKSSSGGPAYSVTPQSSKLSVKKGFVVEVLSTTGSLWIRPVPVSIATSFRDGTRVNISLIAKNGKKSKVATVRVKNGNITFRTKKSGIFQIMKAAQ